MTNSTEGNVFREVSQKASLIAVIRHYLGSSAVIRKGKRFVCRCPFHDDHDPSLTLDEEKDHFHCFVDGHDGDAISFVEQYAKLPPLDALKKVCEICNIPVPESVANHKTFVPQVESQYPKELKALSDLEAYYELALKSVEGQKGRDYLKGRQIPDDVIAHFHIGYAPKDPKAAIVALRNLGAEIPVLQNAGILSRGAGLEDHYSERIMFPIEDNYGHVVAFSGREIVKSGDGRKYVNYPETELFKKSDILYHFAQAKETARKDGFLYIVEGFMDVIAFVRAGINSVVGTMGTALTESHINALKSLGVPLRLALDSDEPGQSAIQRLLPVLRASGIPYSVQRTFTGAKDADECLTKFGKEEFLNQVNRLNDPFLFLMGRAIRSEKSRIDFHDSNAVLRFLNLTRPYYQALDELNRDRDLDILARQTDFSRESLLRILSKEVVEAMKTQTGEPKTDDPDSDGSHPQTERQRREKRSPYRGRSKYRLQEEPVIDIGKFRLKGNYSQEEAVQDMVGITKEYCRVNQNIFELSSLLPKAGSACSDPMEKLVQLEVNMLIVLAQSRDAFRMFEEAHSAFVISPLDAMTNFFGSAYVKMPTLEQIQEEQFDDIIEALGLGKKIPGEGIPENAVAEVKDQPVFSDSKEEDSPFAMDDIIDESADVTVDVPDIGKDIKPDAGLEDDFFDMDGIGEETAKESYEIQLSDLHVPDKDKNIIHFFCSILKLMQKERSRYDEAKFAKSIQQHKTYLSIYNLLCKVRRENGGEMTNMDAVNFIVLTSELGK